MLLDGLSAFSVLYTKYTYSGMSHNEILRKISKDYLMLVVACEIFNDQSDELEKALEPKIDEIAQKAIDLINEEIENIKSTLPA